jgi:hypothetical protein
MKSSLQSMLAQFTCGSWASSEPHSTQGTAAGSAPVSAARRKGAGSPHHLNDERKSDAQRNTTDVA